MGRYLSAQKGKFLLEQSNPPDPVDTSPNDPPSTSSMANQPIEQDDGIVRAAAVLAVGNVASRILGLAREMVKAK